MEPIFTLPYPEWTVAQQLSRHLPSTRGYSLYAPVSRQERGVDLVLTRRTRNGSRVATIQVKSSRTYSSPALTPRSERRTTKRSFRYYTWFNTFECPSQADFFALVALYPAVDQRQYRELGTWWDAQILIFSQKEMRKFLRSAKTVAGTPEKMFGFGFDEPRYVYQTRGDRHRRGQDFSDHLLTRRLAMLRSFLAA